MEKGEEKAKLLPITATARGQPSAIYTTGDLSQLDSNPAVNICDLSPPSADQITGGVLFCSHTGLQSTLFQWLLQSSKVFDLSAQAEIPAAPFVTVGKSRRNLCHRGLKPLWGKWPTEWCHHSSRKIVCLVHTCLDIPDHLQENNDVIRKEDCIFLPSL